MKLPEIAGFKLRLRKGVRVENSVRMGDPLEINWGIRSFTVEEFRNGGRRKVRCDKSGFSLGIRVRIGLFGLK